MQLGAAIARPLGDLTVVGIAGGTIPFGFFSVGYEVSLQTTYWGSITELMELLELARRGVVKAEYTTYSLADAAQGLRRPALWHASRPGRRRPVRGSADR